MRTGRPSTFTDEQKALARQLHAAGQSYSEIGRRLGRHKDSVRGVLVRSSAAAAECDHAWGPAHSLRYPNHVKYGSLTICVRCRKRRYENSETGVVRIDPAVPRDFVFRPEAE